MITAGLGRSDLSYKPQPGNSQRVGRTRLLNTSPCQCRELQGCNMRFLRKLLFWACHQATCWTEIVPWCVGNVYPRIFMGKLTPEELEYGKSLQGFAEEVLARSE